MRTCFIIESNKQKRVKGIEPLFIAWKAIVLPLNYTRWVHFKAYLVFKLEISASLWCSRLLSLSSVPVSLIQRLTVYFKFEPKVVRLRSTFVLFPSHTTNIAMIGEKGKCFHKTLTLCNSRLEVVQSYCSPRYILIIHDFWAFWGISLKNLTSWNSYT